MTILVWCLAGATLSLLVIVPVLNPHLINMNVSNKSGAASDLIGLWSIGIKSLLFYSKLFSQLSIILGAILLFIATIHAMGNNIMNAMSEAPIGLGILFAGFFFPVIVNLVFMILYFIFDIFLAVLSIKGTKASADTAKE